MSKGNRGLEIDTPDVRSSVGTKEDLAAVGTAAGIGDVKALSKQGSFL